MGNINSRRGQISESGDRGLVKFIKATIPLAEMFGYATDLKINDSRKRKLHNGIWSLRKSSKFNVAEEIIAKKNQRLKFICNKEIFNIIFVSF
jgi:elongation factor G